MRQRKLQGNAAWAGWVLGALLALPGGRLEAVALADTVAAVKPSIVAIGTYQKTRSPAIRFVGTGFVTGDGLSVVTNAHVVPELLDSEKMEQLGVVVADGDGVAFRPAQLAGRDREHDLAHLRLAGPPMPALTLGDSSRVREGQDLAFTGFPLGMVLGLHHVTHRAMLAAITPVVMPSLSSRGPAARAIASN